MYERPVFMREKGFSFLQTVLALLVLGIVAAVSVKPMSGLIQRIKLQTAANSMKHVIQNARLRAVANPERQCGVVFRFHGTPAVNDTVFAFLESNPSDKLYTKGKDSLYLAPFILKTKQGISAKVPAGYPTVLVFRGDGSASASAKVVLTIGTMVDTLDVLASTGRVKVVSK